jgi:hypothetical protein
LASSFLSPGLLSVAGKRRPMNIASGPPSRSTSRPKLIWTKPVIRELTGTEAIVRRAETLVAGDRLMELWEMFR